MDKTYSQLNHSAGDFDCEIVKEKKVKKASASDAVEKFVELNRPGAHGLNAKEHESLCRLVAALQAETWGPRIFFFGTELETEFLFEVCPREPLYQDCAAGLQCPTPILHIIRHIIRHTIIPVVYFLEVFARPNGSEWVAIGAVDIAWIELSWQVCGSWILVPAILNPVATGHQP